MTARATLVALVEGVKADITRCSGIEALLAEQRRALMRRDTDRLRALNAELEEHLAAMRASARARSRHLRLLGQSADEHGLTRLLDRLPPALANELRPLWQRLRQGLSRCRAANERNGMLLAGQKELIGQLLGNATTDYAPVP